MKRVILAILLVSFSFELKAQGNTPLVSPVQSGAYLPGIVGIRDYANPGVDGFILLDYNILLNADRYIDRNGNATNVFDGNAFEGRPIDVDITGYINSMMFIYASKKIPFLGNAQYLFIAAPNYTTANTRVALGEIINGGVIRGGASGFGDLTVAPLMLSWTSSKFDLTAGYLFYAPTGRYETGASDNIGLGYWSHIIQAAGYYYPKEDRSTAILLMPSYEFHGQIKDAEVTPGTRFMLEYGISQYISARTEITAQLGHAWQVGEDSGNDVYWDTSIKDRMNTWGIGLGFWVVPEKFYSQAKYTDTFALKQHFDASNFQLEIIWIPSFGKN